MSAGRGAADPRLSAARATRDLHRRAGLVRRQRGRARHPGQLLPVLPAIAQDRRFGEIAFPAIATGVYGFPREAAARIALAAVRAHLAASEMPQRVIFVCFDAATLGAYRVALGREVD